MDLSPAEVAIVELLRAMGAEPLHLAVTSAGAGVAFTLVTAETGHAAGWGPTFEDAFTNCYGVPSPEPASSPPPSGLRVVGGTDRGLR